MVPLTEEQMTEARREFARIGGKAGGVARAKALTPEQRSKIAQKGAKAFWKKWRAERAAKPSRNGGAR